MNNLTLSRSTDTYTKLAEWLKINYISQNVESDLLGHSWFLKKPSFNEDSLDIVKIAKDFQDIAHPLIQIFLLKITQNTDDELFIIQYEIYINYLLQQEKLELELDYNDAYNKLIELYQKSNRLNDIREGITKGIELFKKFEVNIGLGKCIFAYIEQHKYKADRYEKLAEATKIAITQYNIDDNYDWKIWLYKLLIDCYNKYDKKLAEVFRRELYDFYWEAIPNSQYGVKQRYLEEAIEISNYLNLSDQEKFALQEMQRTIGQELQSTMKSHDMIPNHVRPLLNNIITNYKNLIDDNSSDFQQCLFIIIHCCYIDKFLCKTTDPDENKMPIPKDGLLSVINLTYISYDHNGFPTNTTLERYRIVNSPICAHILHPTLGYLFQKFKPTVEDFKFLVEDNTFIPEGLRQSTLRGLCSLAEKDILSFHRILILNIEPIIKHIASICKIPTKKSPSENKSYWEEDINISHFLEHPDIMKEIGSDNARELNMMLFSKHGFRLRARIAHGILEDTELLHFTSTLWFIIVRVLYRGISSLKS